MLTIREEQLQNFRESRLWRSRKRVAGYLRQTAGDYVAELDDEDLLQEVVRFEAVGKSLNLKSERAHAKWAFLMTTTSGEIAGPGPVRDALLSVAEQSSSDAMLHLIFDELVRFELAEKTGAL